MPDGTYAPQSPDLSSFLSSNSPPKQPPTSSYAPRSPNLQPFFSTPRPANDDLVYSERMRSGHHPFVQQQTPPLRSFRHVHSAAPHADDGNFNTNPLARGYPTSIPDLPPSHKFPPQQSQTYQPQHPVPSGQPFKSESDYNFESSQTNSAGQFDMATRSKRGAVKPENDEESGKIQVEDLGPSQGIDIKTKFPVARIKRIMQADEEVGKVAQVTPVAVSKALELFMISLVTKSATIAKSSNSKRVTAQHLKKAIESDVQFDFLTEIVSRVVEGPDAGGKRVKSEDGSDDEEGDKGGRSAKKAKGRRKKGE